MNKEGLAYVVVFTFLLGLIFVAALTAVEFSTRDRVILNARVAEYGAVLDALGEDVSQKNAQATVDDFAKLFPAAAKEERITYPLTAQVKGEKVLVDRFSGKGLWGKIDGVIAVNTKVDEIVGLTVVEQNETPGLGGRIVEPWFKEQFRGEQVSGEFKVTPAQAGGGDKDHSNGRIDAIAGATLTSRYMEVIVNDAMDSLRKKRDEGGLG